MADLLNDLEIAPPSVVSQAARDFARALAGTPQFQAYEEAEHKLRTDQAAQHALEAYRSKQQSTHMTMMLKTASEADRAELERLRQAFQSDPTVAAYFLAQGEAMALCQAAAEQLSRHIGLSFTSACGPGCC